MKYRVHYPLITCDSSRDFDTRAEAEAFAGQRRNCPTMGNMWRHVRIEEITPAAATAGTCHHRVDFAED